MGIPSENTNTINNKDGGIKMKKKMGRNGYIDHNNFSPSQPIAVQPHTDTENEILYQNREQKQYDLFNHNQRDN
jgi:hypothetical protein